MAPLAAVSSSMKGRVMAPFFTIRGRSKDLSRSNESMDSNLYQDPEDLDVLAQARRNARALSAATRMGDETSTMVNAARLRRALFQANATLGKTSSLRDLTRAAELYALTVETRTLRDTAPSQLSGESSARVIRWCTSKTSIGLSGTHADLFEVDASDRELSLATLSNLFLLRVRFARTSLIGAWMNDVVLDQCILNAAMACSTQWNSAQLTGCQLIGCDLSDASLSFSVFTDCDFRGADLGALRRPDQDGLVGTIFVRCDLRDTQWVGRRLHNVVLSECKLHGVRGRPKLEGLTIVKPDLSPDGDGSCIGTADEVRALWENPLPILCSKAPAEVGDHGLPLGGAFSPENGPDGTDLGLLMALSSALPGVRQ
jgi:uncharacterized protein YjbI with pentapeptide repeats